MRPAALLSRVRSLGIRVAEEDGQLRVEGDGLTDDLVAELRAAKAEVLALLRIEATRSTRCPCGSCCEPGAVQHGPRCYCGPCLDLDPRWEEWRAEADAEERAKQEDAVYEAEERLAIQEEACTPAELDAFKRAVATANAAPGRWVNPDLSSEDLALLRDCERLDHIRAAAALLPSSYCCGGRDWWSARDGRRVCRRCHPPVPGAEVVEAVAAQAATVAKEGA